MIETNAALPLPAARALSRGEQVRWLLIAVAVAVALVAFVAVVRWATAPKPEVVVALPPGTFRPTREQLAAFTIERVGGPGSDATAATGQISVDETRATPVFLPYSGQIVSVLADAGARVMKGQPLAQVRTTDVVDAAGALRTAEAQRSAAASQVLIARENAVRAEAIYKTAGGALRDFQSAQNDLIAAQSALRTAQTAAESARARLAIFGGGGGGGGATMLRAPIGGVVTTRAASPGQFVTVGGDKPLFVVADLSQVWLVAQLGESEAAQVRIGDRVTVTTAALPGRSFTATIDFVSPAIDPTTRRLPVRATIANADGALKPETFASFAITRAGSGVGVTVPATAVIHEGDIARVWTLRRDGLLQAREVRVGGSEDGRIHVLAGLAAGDRIVTSGALFVNEAGLGS